MTDLWHGKAAQGRKMLAQASYRSTFCTAVNLGAGVGPRCTAIGTVA